MNGQIKPAPANSYRWRSPWRPRKSRDNESGGSKDAAVVDHTARAAAGQKRAREDTSRAVRTYPRKRASAACHLCRLRKIKCNNARPSCLSCTQSGGKCVYEDSDDHTSFDPASLLILDHLSKINARLDTFAKDSALSAELLDHLGKLLGQSGRYSCATVKPIAQQASDTRSSYLGLFGQPFSAPSTLSQDATLDVDSDPSLHCLRTPSSRGTAEDILRWPVFAKYPLDLLTTLAISDGADESSGEEDCSFPQVSSTGAAKSPKGKKKACRSGTRGIREDKIPDLIESFLTCVHIKNPILNDTTLRRYATSIAENGLTWDGRSCLVLVACALGSIARPFSTLNSLENCHHETSLERDSKALALAESYYIGACKRFGLLGRSLQTSQCFFLSGVYLMYTFRQLEAWQAFSQASTNLYIYVRGRERESDTPDAHLKPLEQRLYWSCLKSECEIRLEIPLPESGIFDLNYPDLFPSPPHSSLENEYYSLSAPDSAQGSGALSSSGGDITLQDQSWYYYLTEIGLRRLTNRIVNTFYKHDSEETWSLMGVAAMISLVEGFQTELKQWYDGLPASIRFDQDNLQELPNNELQFFVRARYINIQSWLLRPFLYYAVHKPFDDPSQLVIRPFALGAIANSCHTIESHCVLHRHHGTWYNARNTTAAALVITAGVRCGHLGLSLNELDDHLQMAIKTLRFWEDESGDLVAARCMLEEIVSELSELDQLGSI